MGRRYCHYTGNQEQETSQPSHDGVVGEMGGVASGRMYVGCVGMGVGTDAYARCRLGISVHFRL